MIDYGSLKHHEEQRSAIFHRGGVLLDAGAGAGKTFVIVEHLLHLIESFIVEFKLGSKDNFELFILDRISKIVVMTFTNKSTDELRARIKKRISELRFKSDHDLWEIVATNIDILKVSTIHGLCYSLIKEFGFDLFKNKFEIVSKVITSNKIKKLVGGWFEINSSKLDDLVVLNFKTINKIIQEVFDDPIKRESFERNNDVDLSFEEILIKVMELMDLTRLFDYKVNLNLYSEHSKSKWFQVLKEFNDLNLINNLNGLKSLISFLDNLNRMPPVKKDLGLTEVETFFSKLKQMKDLARDLIEFNDKFRETKSEFTKIKNIILEILLYVEENYLNDSNYNYSDIEYYTLKLLNNVQIKRKINSKYNYFIVDEFQDTSIIQFSILQKLIDDDYNRLFCVGDLKQAIYGFRGGEISVFNECSLKINQQLKLLNNFRSYSFVVEFNNKFFDHVLKQKNLNNKLIEFSPQNIIERDIEQSSTVSKLVSGEKIENVAADELEAEIIFRFLNKSQEKNIAILYKTLAPSHYLIEKLFDSGLMATFQVKISLSDDWIIGILKLVLGYAIATSKKRYFAWMCRKYLELLKISFSEDDMISLLDKFVENLVFLNTHSSFLILLKSFKISFSTFRPSLELIENICIVANNSIEKIFHVLEDNLDSSFNYEIEINGGKNIMLMTAHSSKGLEFENVILAGIYSNFRSKNNTDKLGESLNSFIYESVMIQSEKIKTPIKFFDEMADSVKQKSESDRLLYVACTRAKRNLFWIDLKIDTIEKINKNSWAYHFVNWDQIDPFNELVVDVDSVNSKLTKMRIFDLDNFTVEKTINNLVEDFLIVSELSVTKLATVVYCPRKFYYMNICKLTEEDLENLNIKDRLVKIVSETNDNGLSSNATRGTQIHSMIERFIKNNEFESSVINNQFINFVYRELKSCFLDKNWGISSEHHIKFKLFNFMITGTIDLVLENKILKEIIIVDYKTGARDFLKEEAYWFQLKCYAYGLSKINKQIESDNYKIQVQIIYLDEEVNLKTVCKLEQIETEIFMYWKKVNNFNQTNSDHCHVCEYYKICQV